MCSSLLLVSDYKVTRITLDIDRFQFNPFEIVSKLSVYL